LLYGSETWTVKARDARRITAAEMKYMRRTAGYIWTDYRTNVQIAKELNGFMAAKIGLLKQGTPEE